MGGTNRQHQLEDSTGGNSGVEEINKV